MPGMIEIGFKFSRISLNPNSQKNIFHINGVQLLTKIRERGERRYPGKNVGVDDGDTMGFKKVGNSTLARCYSSR